MLSLHGTNSRALDTALVDDDAAIRVLSHNIDANGTGDCYFNVISFLASMLANLIQDGKALDLKILQA